MDVLFSSKLHVSDHQVQCSNLYNLTILGPIVLVLNRIPY